MRLATAVGQTHWLLFINKLSFSMVLRNFNLVLFKFQFVCVFHYRQQKYKLFLKKRVVVYIYCIFLHRICINIQNEESH
jgi:hypothetical protein